MNIYTYAQPNDDDPIFIEKNCPGCNITSNGGCVTGLCNQNFSYYQNILYDIPLNCKVPNNYQCFCEWGKLRNVNSDYHSGSPTLFHPEFGNLHTVPGVPDNYFGTQADNTYLNNSTGYMGLTTYAPNNRRDYLMLSNGYMMTAGNTYVISFYASLAEVSGLATSIQMYVGPSLPNFPSGSATHINMTFPTQHYRTSPVISNFNGWTYITFTYTATTTGLHQIYLGNFRNNLLTPVFSSNAPVLPGVGKIPNFSYVYIDDFNITPIAANQELCCNFDHIVGYGPFYPYFPDTLNNYSILPGQKVFIHDVVWINRSITYSNVDFLFDANAILMFENGVDVTFDNCRFHGCYALWQGMQAFSGNVILTFNNCTIEDMESGIMLTGGSPLTLNNCKFNNNRRSLELKDFNSIWPLTMRANVFQQQGAFKPFVWFVAPVYSITNYVQPEVHIELKNVFWANVTAPTGMANRNHFKHAIVGIHAVNSGLTVSNAFFNQIKYLQPSGQLFGGNIVSTIGWAVKATAPATGLRGIKVFNQWGNVRIQQCDNGIEISGGYYSEIKNNTLFNIKGTGIKQQNTMPWPTWNNTTSQIQINNNQIQMVTVGVDLYNNGNTLTEVKENTIQNTAYRDRSVAIRAQNLLLKPSKCKFSPDGFLKIENNNIFRFETGIQADLCNCLKISSNEVVLNNPNWDQAHGIWVRSSLGALIDDNNIYGSGTQWYSQGIRLEFSPQTTISCNYVNNTENALWIHNNNIGSILLGNKLSQYQKGIHLTYHGIVGPQLFANDTSFDLHNTYTLNGSQDYDFFTSSGTDGSNSPFYLRNFIMNQVISSGVNPIEKIVSDDSYKYQTFCRNNNLQTRLSFSNFNNPYAQENRWLNKQKHQYWFKALGDSLTYFIKDTAYVHQMNDSIQQTNIKEIYEVDSLMALSEWGMAAFKVNSIAPQHEIDLHWKKIADILIRYMPTLSQCIDTSISQTDLTYLNQLANSCLYQFGEPVLKARILLSRHYNDTLVFAENCTEVAMMPRYGANETDTMVNSSFFSDVLLYPNPAEEYFHLFFSNTDIIFDIKICDMQGREWVIEKNNSTFQPIDISGLSKGYYLAILEYNGLIKQIPFIKQ